MCAIPQHDDKTHAEVLALIDELLAIGARKQPTGMGNDGLRRSPRRLRPSDLQLGRWSSADERV